ncbi:hypothetical protein LguiA_008783 [Lonicera macranthoides]
MASISPRTFPSPSSTPPNPIPHKFTFTNPRFPFLSPKLSPCSLSFSFSRVSDSSTCRCHNNNNNDNEKNKDKDKDNDNDNSSLFRRWDLAINGVIKSAMKIFDDYMYQSTEGKEDVKSLNVVERETEVEEEEEQEWDWERWRNHFSDVDEQERIVSILKSQLIRAINREDYEDAARLKVAIAAAATNDTVGRVMSYLNRAIEEERYLDAAFVRDYAGAGLVGWWAGVSEDSDDPYGHIIHIDAEHGRYVARSYNPRQLSTTTIGAPLFEIFLTTNKKGGYKQQVVYLKRGGVPQDFAVASSKPVDPTSSLNLLDPTDSQDHLLTTSIEDTDDSDIRDDDSDIAEGPGFENILRDMIAGVKVKVLKVTTPETVDRDLISKVVEQIMEEEDEDKDNNDIESIDNIEDGVKGESDDEKNEIKLDGSSGITDGEEQSRIAIKLRVDDLIEKIFSGKYHEELLRVPAKLEKKDRLSFSFSIEEVEKRKVSGNKVLPSLRKKPKRRARHNVDHVMFDLVKSIGRGKIPRKLLRDVSELINPPLSQTENRPLLSGSTTFNRIETSSSPDPLNGLYISAHGLYTSEVIHLRRKFGQWQEDGTAEGNQNLEFYEYVEAVKLTGDPYVPAGQVAFRAKVGKRYQLPHKGIIPEEFGVIARYRGQGRLAEPGFHNPRWVDGELVILDGKYIKGGPVVGFVYWAPEYQFLVFFNQLRLKQ